MPRPEAISINPEHLPFPQPVVFFVVGHDGMPLFTHSLPDAVQNVDALRRLARIITVQPLDKTSLTIHGEGFLATLKALGLPIINLEEASVERTLQKEDPYQNRALWIVGLSASDPDARYFLSYRVRAQNSSMLFFGAKGVAPLRDAIAEYYDHYLPHNTQLIYAPDTASSAVSALIGAFDARGVELDLRLPEQPNGE